MTGFFRSACAALRRRLPGTHASEILVRRVLLEQPGIAALELVRGPPGTPRGRHLLVRIRIAEGCDAREVSRAAAQALFRTSAVTEVRLVEHAGDRPAFER